MMISCLSQTNATVYGVPIRPVPCCPLFPYASKIHGPEVESNPTVWTSSLALFGIGSEFETRRHKFLYCTFACVNIEQEEISVVANKTSHS